VDASEKTEFFVHYHGAPPPQGTGKAVAKNVERIHVANGWSGVGYNFMVDQDGVVYEGRGWNLVGAHCPGHNRQGWGVYVAVGGDQEPSVKALSAVAALYKEACERAGKPLAKKGHRDGKATSCPGENLYAWVKAGMVDPAAPAKPVAPKKTQPAAKKDRTLKIGMSGHDVANVQRAVGQKTDMKFGPNTADAVKAFQKKHGLTADGVVGPNTWAALRVHVHQKEECKCR
jgi:hypothetical protein